SVSGSLTSGDAMTLDAMGRIELSDTSQLAAGGVLSIRSGDALTVSGDVQGEATGSLAAGGYLLVDGTVATLGSLTLDGSSLEITLGGSVSSTGDSLMMTTPGTAVIAGAVSGQTDLTLIATGETTISGSAEAVTGDLTVDTESDLTISGRATSGHDMTLDAAGKLTITETGIVTAGNDLFLIAGSGLSIDGQLSFGGSGWMIVTGDFLLGGQLTAGVDLTVGATGRVEISGTLSAGQILSIDAGEELRVTASGDVSATTLNLDAGTDLYSYGSVNTNLVDGEANLVAGDLMFFRTDDPLTSHVLNAESGTGMMLITEVDQLTAHVAGSGILEIRETDAVELAEVTNADGPIRVRAGGTVTATDVRSLRDAQWNNVALLTTAGDVEIGYAEAGWNHGQIILSSAGSIVDADATDRTRTDLNAHTLFLYAHDTISGLETRSRQYHWDTGPDLDMPGGNAKGGADKHLFKGHIEVFFDVQGSVNIKSMGEMRVTSLVSHDGDVRLQSTQDEIYVEQIGSTGDPNADVTLHAHRDILVAAETFSGDSGFIESDGNLSLFSALGNVDYLGDLDADGELDITAKENLTGTGKSRAGEGLTYQAQRGRMDLAGDLSAGDDAKLHAQGDLTIFGDIVSGDDVAIRSTRSDVNLHGDITAVDRIDVWAGGTINVDGTLDAGGGVYLHPSPGATGNGRQNMLAFGVPTELSDAEHVSEDALAAIVAEAIARWSVTSLAQESGIDLGSTPVQIIDLPGQILGQAREGRVLIDQDAAGYGWFIDATPADDVEFLAIEGEGLRAETGIAAGSMDLLTVVMHEFGHILGLRDLGPGTHDGDLMVGILELGERRNPLSSETVTPMDDQVDEVDYNESAVPTTSTLIRRDAAAVSRIPAPASNSSVRIEETRDLLFAQLSGNRPRPSRAMTSHESQARPAACGDGWFDELARDLAGADGHDPHPVDDVLDDLLKPGKL
ncbi:MAG: hypothetical protein WD049_05430, partial [Candidatus Paceibacterota bacterium]